MKDVLKYFDPSVTQYSVADGVSHFSVEVASRFCVGGVWYGASFACQKGESPVEIARALSWVVSGEVTVTAMARVRAVFCGGELVREWPSLSHFYAGISVEQERCWREFLPVPE